MSIRYGVLFVVTILLSLVPARGLAQVPNAGFENWTLGEPDGWATSNAPPVYTNVTESGIAHSGAHAVRGVVVSIPPAAIQPVLQSGEEGEGFAHTQRSAEFTGYYQFFPQGGDRFGINVALFNGGANGTPVAFAAAALPTPQSSYTQFSVPFLYVSGDAPDTCVVQIQIIGPTQNDVHVGSYFLLDDIALTGTVGVDEREESVPAELHLAQNFPNPFNPSTNIEFRVKNMGFVSLKVYDVLGREVATLVDDVKSPGRYGVVWDATTAASGVYFARLISGTTERAMRMILAR